ncbi:hypothetical protein DBR40_04985 [Pedobacter sp. KBW01]|uniref:TlpA family protein disulfide reductase n=1 Tax=Pedobacter sp. KBW01 TaxID=2153364 RepID=UPI000F5A6205|nr:thioredoxin family protein [Pedobacter sp. KBW01]RQO79077.1 hypothetical protein DBR40_04985 [Pedobacter sp. KBW01]
MKNLIAIFLTITLYCGKVNGQFNEPKSPTFSGTFQCIKETVPDSILIVSYPQTVMKNKTSRTIKLDNDGNFNFKLSEIKKTSYIRMIAYNAGRQTIIGSYFVEPDDNVTIKIVDHPKREWLGGLPIAINFIGNGSEKYNMIEKLQDQYQEYRKQLKTIKFDLVSDTPSLSYILKNVTDLSISFAQKKERLINENKTINPDIRILLNNEYGMYYNSWLTIMEGYINEFKHSPNLLTIVRAYFNKYQKTLFVKPSEVSVISPIYIQTLVLGLKSSIKINDTNGKIDLKKYYYLVKNSYSGLIQERLLTEFFTTPQSLIDISNFDQNTYDTLVVDASKFITNPLYSNLISEKIKLKKGGKLFDAEFIDLNGNPFNTASLKGKIILIDIWGEGCTACAIFHQKFEKEIYPEFKDNKDFVVLSISVDTKKDKWLNGIKSGKMSSNHYINISTGDLSIRHPFLKYYGIYAIPFILLVDKEHRNIANLSSVGLTLKSNEIIDMINNALGNSKAK